MTDELLVDLAPWGATVVSLVIAWLTHRRAKVAQGDQVTIDRTRLIQDGYQSLLDDLQSELNRLKTDNERDRKEWNTKEKELRRRVTNLSGELREERDQRIRLEERVEALTTELARVEKRNGFFNERDKPDEGDADGGV